jgi:hypothetical protein
LDREWDTNAWPFVEIQFGSRVHILPLPKSCIWKWRENLQNILHIHLHNIYLFAKFHEKLIFFVVYVKKRKFILWTTLFLNTEFCLFPHATWQVDFFWNDFVRAHDVKMYVRFFFLKFYFFKHMCKIHFKVKELVLPCS